MRRGQVLRFAIPAALGDRTTAEATSAVLSAVFDFAAIGIALVADNGVPFEVNAACCRILGYRPEQLTSMSCAQLTHPEDVTVEWRLNEELRRGERDDYQIDKRYLRADGEIVWAGLTVSAVRRHDGALWFAVVMIEDITERRRLADDLRRQALTDPLTGLGNRTLLDDRLAHALARAARTGALLGLLFVDLDGFKKINDRHGHAAGDHVLREIGLRLTEAARHSDTVARVGGDEFVLLCEGLRDEQEAADVAARIRQTVARPVLLGTAEYTLGASVGVAFPQPGDSSDGQALLKRADAAMYKAKRAQRSER